MIQKILAILNRGGVHHPTIQEFRDMADYLYIPIGGIDRTHLQAINTVALMERWEELTKQPLKKEHFIYNVDRASNYPLKEYESELKSAQQEVLFIGFEFTDTGNRAICGGLTIDWSETMSVSCGLVSIVHNPTLADLITEIERQRKMQKRVDAIRCTEAIAGLLLEKYCLKLMR